MLAPLMLGSLMVVGNMAIQIWALLLVVALLLRRLERVRDGSVTAHGSRLIGIVVLLLFLGHLLQFATWAALFLALDEFPDFATAFYHSAVNFTSLGYGDIVMSERWRLLGGLEAANGVLMFGLSAGAILSMMNRVFLHGQDRPGGGLP